MIKSKLVKLLRSFLPSELRKFEQHLVSPASPVKEEVVNLLRFIRKQTVWNDTTLDRLKAYATLYPDKKHDDQHLRHLQSSLLKAAEEFLLLRAAVSQPLKAQMEILKIYQQRKLGSSFDSKVKAFEKQLEKSSERHEEYYYHRYQFHQTMMYNIGGRAEEAHTLLQSMTNDLDLYFAVAKLRHACAVISHQKMFKKDYDLGLLEAVLSKVEEGPMQSEPAIQLYYHTYRMLAQEDESAYRILRELLSDQSHILPETERRDLYLHTLNYCITHLNKGNKAFLRDIFLLYKEGVMNEVLMENGVLSPWTYKNIVSAGLKLEEIEWIEEFVEKYRSHLPVVHQPGFYQYNRARIHFVKEEFKEVSHLLQKVNIKDPFTMLAAKVLLIESHVESEKLELAEYALLNFLQLLKRKKGLTYHKTGYINFAKMGLKLVQLDPQDAEAGPRLRQEVMDLEMLVERDWLLTKL